jgi:hypothetical protein
MGSHVKSIYSVIGSIGTEDVTAHVILDRKNNSVHVHFYGKIFGNIQKPILVKHSNAKFPEDGGVDLVKQVVIGELTDKKVQIKRVTSEAGAPVEQTKAAQRTIIRFRK